MAELTWSGLVPKIKQKLDYLSVMTWPSARELCLRSSYLSLAALLPYPASKLISGFHSEQALKKECVGFNSTGCIFLFFINNPIHAYIRLKCFGSDIWDRQLEQTSWDMHNAKEAKAILVSVTA
jgi:hypothetical protein